MRYTVGCAMDSSSSVWPPNHGGTDRGRSPSPCTTELELSARKHRLPGEFRRINESPFSNVRDACLPMLDRVL